MRTSLSKKKTVSFRLLQKDGEYREVLASTRVSKDANGNYFLSAYYIDMTEQKKMETLRRSLIDHLPCGAGVFELVNNDLIAVYLNHRYAEMFGMSNDRLIGQSILERIHPKDYDAAMRMLHAVIFDGQKLDCDIRLRLKNDEYPACRRQ